MPKSAPVPISLTLCDDVIYDQTSRKWHVIGWADCLRAVGFPHRARDFKAFIPLSGTEGPVNGHLECFGPSGEQVFASPNRKLNFPRPDRIVLALFRLRGIRLPVPGVYSIHGVCDNPVISRRSIRVLPKGANGDV